jgi:hypothetical protein
MLDRSLPGNNYDRATTTTILARRDAGGAIPFRGGPVGGACAAPAPRGRSPQV